MRHDVTKTFLSFTLRPGVGVGGAVMGMRVCMCLRCADFPERGRWQIKHSYIPYFSFIVLQKL